MNPITRKKIIEYLTDFYAKMMNDCSVSDTANILLDIYKDGYKDKGWTQMSDQELLDAAQNELKINAHINFRYFKELDELEEGGDELYQLVKQAEIELEAHKLLTEEV